MDCTKRTPNQFLRFLFFAIIAFIIGAIISYFFKNHTQTTHVKKSIVIQEHMSLSTKNLTHKNNLQEQTLFVRNGDFLAVLFHRAGLPADLWIDILKSHLAASYLDHLQIGHSLSIFTNSSHQFSSLIYSIDLARSLQITKIHDHFIARIIRKPVTKALQFKSSIIHHNLYQAERTARLPPNLDHELDVMLARSHIIQDIRPGDRLEVLYHEYFVNDEKDHPGNIVAAEITNGKNHYRVVRYTAPDDVTGYYKSNGQGTMPEFMRIPLHYVRIGSRFSYDRYDPILHRIQPHLGIDFDAPMGTPVRAIGNGVVVFCGQMRGYGNVLIVRYGHIYKSLYAHLEKFALHIRDDERVKKGEIIGYVGMTGWTTGPHLHFAVFKNGVAVNPLTVQFPHESPIPGKYRHLFFDKEDHWFHEMKLYEHAKLASK